MKAEGGGTLLPSGGGVVDDDDAAEAEGCIDVDSSVTTSNGIIISRSGTRGARPGADRSLLLPHLSGRTVMMG